MALIFIFIAFSFLFIGQGCANISEAQELQSIKSWYIGCHRLQSNVSINILLEWFESPPDGRWHIVSFHQNYSAVETPPAIETPPVYGSQLCQQIGFPYVAILSNEHFYCLASLLQLEVAENSGGQACSERCTDGLLLCGSTSQQYVSIYNSSSIPYLLNTTFYEPNGKRFTHRRLEFKVSANVIQPYGLGIRNGSWVETLVPVECLFKVDGETVLSNSAIEEIVTLGRSRISCILEHRFVEQGTFLIEVEMTSAWQTANSSLSISITNELPARPDIIVYLSDFELPTCISNQAELDATENKETVKVYVDTPTPFKASIGQGFNVTFNWMFDNVTTHSHTADSSSCGGLSCYRSIVWHGFTTLGVHEVAVRFSNRYGQVATSLSVIVVSKDIHNVSVVPEQTSLTTWADARLAFSVLTSSRYFTYIEINLGDGTVSRFSAADPIINRMDQNLRPAQRNGYRKVTSSYGIGCLLTFDAYIAYSTREGHYNLTWSVFNNDTMINSTEPIPYSVYEPIAGMKFQGHLSYQVGMTARISVYFDSVSYEHTSRWTLINADTGETTYTVTEERGDEFSLMINATGTFNLRCEVWNPVSEPLRKEVLILILERLGNLYIDPVNDTLRIPTHRTLTFGAHLDSGFGANYFWNVTSVRRSVSYIAQDNLGLTGECHVTFVQPDIYNVSVSARIGAVSTSSLHVRTVYVYEKVSRVTCIAENHPDSNCAIKAFLWVGSDVSVNFYYPGEVISRDFSLSNQITVAPSLCPAIGVHDIRLVASNLVSSVESSCPVIVQPSADSVTISVTAASQMQLSASVLPADVTDQVLYVWWYEQDGRGMESVSALPFLTLQESQLNSSIVVNLHVYGLKGGTLTVPPTSYQHTRSLLDHPTVVKPNEPVVINVKNVEDFSSPVIRVFSDECFFNQSQSTCTVSSDRSQVATLNFSAFDRSGNEAKWSSIIAVVPVIPGTLDMACPERLAASRYSQTLVRVSLAEGNLADYFAYFTWYKNDEMLANTAVPAMPYEFSTEGDYNITIVASNAWGSVSASCFVTAITPLIELEVKPTVVYKIGRYRLILEPTDITVIVYGPRTLFNLTIDYGDGQNTTYNASAIQQLRWSPVDPHRSSFIIEHQYETDKQHRVYVTASTAHSTVNATGIVYRSVAGVLSHLIGAERGSNFEKGETAVLMTTVQYGNYLSFEWFYDGRVDVIETSKNHSKVAVKLKALGHPNITCIVHHPAYPDGIPVDFSQILLVVIKPGPIAIGAVGDITSAELTAGTLNITFYIRYTAGPDNALVELWGDYANGPLSGETISKCETEVLTLVVCRAYASHVYNKAGLYNVTMLLMVGDEPYYKSMSFEVIPPKMLLAFTDPHRIVAGQLPIYYFHANDTAKFNVELQSTESITLPITYRWSFGDQEMQFEEAGFHTNISHKYTSIREAGFTVSVVASNTEISMEAIAMAIIYKPIQRVELLVEGRSWTEENQGKLYFLPDELINSLHLIVKVYPENVPFESCHIVKGTPYDEPTVTNTFFPENTEVDMHAYDSNFIVVNNRPILRRLVVSALCVNVRLPDVPINKVHAEVLTIYRRTPILRMYYQHPSAASPKIKIGNNLTYDCRGLDNSNDGYYTHYLDGEIIAEGMGQALVTFTPMRDDVYNLTCHIDNGVSEKSFTMLLPVTNFACDVTLIIKSKSLPNAEAVVLPSQWYSSEAITLQGLMKRDGCQAATNWSMSWEVKKMEGDSLVEVGVYIPPFSDLYLPPRTLAPGNYIISWNVSIVGTKFKQSVSERLIISPTPFRAVIAGGIARKLGASIEQDVELDGSMSYDPDCPDCDDLQYLWACNILHKLNTSCFVNSSKIEFSAEKRTSINTASLAPSGQKEGYQISLVVFRGSRSVVVKQTLDTKQEDDSTISTSDVEAKCETCVDGLDLRSSIVRPLVIKAECHHAHPDKCSNFEYSWKMFRMTVFSRSDQARERCCSLRDTYLEATTPQSTIRAEATTQEIITKETIVPTTIFTTSLVPDGSGGDPVVPIIPRENTDGLEEGQSILFVVEDHGSGTDEPSVYEGGISSTTTDPLIFDNIDYSHAYGYGGYTRRQPYTTTPAISTTSTPAASNIILDGCTCAIDGDLVVTNFNLTIYESDRKERVAQSSSDTIGGSGSKDFIIKPNILNSESTYLVELKVDTGSGLSEMVYLVTTGEVPKNIVCYPSYLRRRVDKNVDFLAFNEYSGEELHKAYLFQCEFPQAFYHDYAYIYEVYVERRPGELEFVYRSYTNDFDSEQLQRLPAGFPEHNYTVNIEMHVVDLNGNRFVTCPQEGKALVQHRILPKAFNGTSTSEAMYDLVRRGEDFDWYDDERSRGNVFTIRNNMFVVSEVLNRVAESEFDDEQVEKRTVTRGLLLKQLIDTPHRYMAEVEQKLVVLRSIVMLKPELDTDSTVAAADLLEDLVTKFIAVEPTDRARDVNFTTHLVIDISSNLVRCLSANLDNLYGHTSKLDRIINTIVMASVKERLVPAAEGETMRRAHGMTIVTSHSTKIADKVIASGDVSFTVPAAALQQLSEDYNVKECHTASMTEYATNPFKQGVDSVVTALTLFDCDGEEMRVKKLHDPESYIKFTLPSISNQTQTGFNFTIDKAEMNYHLIDIDRKPLDGKSLNIIFRFTVYEEHTFPLAILIRKDAKPTPHQGGYDIMKQVSIKETELQLFLSSADIGSATKIYLAVSDANFNEGKPRGRQVTERMYSLSSWWSECVYWDTQASEWSRDGCRVGKETSSAISHCSCSHLTAFASKREVIRVKVERCAVDRFFSLKNYPTTKVMVSLILVIYVVLAIVCYVADQKSPVQEKVIAIQDNSPSDRQRYIITIETGSEASSGTTAKVSLVLHGEEGMSETRELIGPIDSNVFMANSRDTFLLTLPSSLGPIWKVQLWHNNKGCSPGWYVKRVTVRDLETRQSYYFLCEHWLAVEESDGKVEREFMALDSHIGFKVVFNVKAPQYFNDYHLIRSLIYKPTFSHFSRLERLTCVFVGLLAHMVLCTAYFYLKVEEFRGEYHLFDLSTHTILVSLGVNAIACPLMLTLSMIFRRSTIGGRPIFPTREHKKYKHNSGSLDKNSDDGRSPQPPHVSHSFLEQSLQHWQSLQEWAQKQWEKRYQKALLAGEELNNIEMQMQEQVLTLAEAQAGGSLFSGKVDHSKASSQSDVKCLIRDSESSSNSSSSQGSSSVRSFMKSRRWFLPSWFRLFAWVLCFGCSAGSAFATIHYSKEFQEGRFVRWLQAIFVTFLFCNFLIQPMGILSKAVLTALWYRRDPTVLQHFPDRYEDDIEEIRVRFSNISEEDEITRGTRARQRSRYLRFARPPQERQLIAARKRTMKEKKFMNLAAEFCVLALNLTLLLVVVLCCERDKSFNLNSHVKALISTNEITARYQAFNSIKRPHHLWDWLQNDLKDLLFTEHAHNLGASIIIGNASRIKQVRVQDEECMARGRMPAWTMRDYCHPSYSRYTVDKDTYKFGDKNISFSEVTGTEDALIYGKLTSYTESGYEMLLPVTEPEFIKAIDELRSFGWADKKTRAVFVELTIYNLPTHLYCSVTAVLEFSATGQIIPSIDVDSAKLYRYRSTNGYVVLTAELIFIFVYLCQLHFNIISVVKLRRQYFTQIWNILDCLSMILSAAYIVIYLYRFEIVEMLHNELQQTFHTAFVNVAPLVFWDRVLCLLLGLLLFITVVKTLKLFRYIKTFARLGNVYRRAARDIRAFAVLFGLLLITFANLGVALFQSVSHAFSDYWHGIMSVTEFLSGSIVSYHEFEHTMPFWGGAYIVLLAGAGHAILLSLAVAMLTYHLRDFKQDTILAMDLKEALGFMFKKLMRRFSNSDAETVEDNDSQDLSPEFALAEMEYQVEELLFKMSALCDGVSLPAKPNLYYTTGSDPVLTVADTLQSGRIGQEKDDEGSLSRLLHLQNIGTEIGDNEQTYNRSQLELDVLRQLQMAHPRDAGINVWDNLRGVSVEGTLSEALISENEIPIHRHDSTLYHTYDKGDSDDDSNGSFISIPDESHTPFSHYTSSSPPEKPSKHKQKKQASRSDSKHCANAEVYEMCERTRPVFHDIEYHNDAYVSDVEIELDVEFTPSPYRRGGRHIKKTKSVTSKSQAYQNQAYDDDDEGSATEQTDL